MEQDYLVHYGVLGMKWGVRKDRYKKTGNKKKSSSKTNESSKKKKGLSNKQKTAIKVGVGIAAGLLIAYGGYKLGQSGKLNSLINRGKMASKNILSGSVEGLGVEGLSKNKTIKGVVAGVNPFKGTAEGSKNCTFCSVATALRMKGVNATALGSSEYHNLAGVLENSFKNVKVYEPRGSRMSSAAQASESLLKRFKGEDSFGAISLPFNNGGGHAFNWEIKNGTVNFFDGQQELEDASKYFNFVNPNGFAQFARLDNLEINESLIDKVVKRR